ncbi:lysosomal phospholipase A and acyltransferase-like [Oscarella lobularis]|uniref:lysosomal phospholipase A and acyltransferase-like n=1 Tax=Oscarella lobularis TaxID=121494 RepID=UPI00331332B9
MAFWLLTIVSVATHFLTTYGAVKSPIVIVPGLAGSRIDARLNKTTVPHELCDKTSDWYPLWVNIEDLIPYVIECWVANMKLVYDRETGNWTDPAGVYTRIPGFGNTSTIEYLDPSLNEVGAYFNVFVSEMAKEGYVPGESIRGAPYDWRFTPVDRPEYFTQLRLLIEDTYKTNGNRKVTLVAHSLGCLQTLYFLNDVVADSWKSLYVASFIPIAGPWAGAANSMRGYASGYNLKIPILSAHDMRPVQRSAPSSAWLMPTPRDWSSEPIVVTSTKNYTVNDYEAFFADIDFPIGFDVWKNVSNVTQSLAFPDVTLHCIYGANVSTVAQVVYAAGDFPNGDPTSLYGNGDGTVNEESLVLCNNWKGDASHDVTTRIFPNINHFDMVSDLSVIDYVKTIVLS